MSKNCADHRRHRLRERFYNLSLRTLEKIEQMLAFPLVRKKTEDEGKVLIFEPVKFTMGTVASLLDVANASLPPHRSP